MLLLRLLKANKGITPYYLIRQGGKQFPQALIYCCVNRSAVTPAVHYIPLKHLGQDKVTLIL